MIHCNSVKVIRAIWICALAAIASWAGPAEAVVIDHVVAFVDNLAITQSDLDALHAERLGADPGQQMGASLDELIERTLIIAAARALGLDAPTDDALAAEYVDLKIKSGILVLDSDVRAYYRSHKAEFGDSPFDEVRDAARERLLASLQAEQLKRHIGTLRERSRIRVRMNPGERP